MKDLILIWLNLAANKKHEGCLKNQNLNEKWLKQVSLRDIAQSCKRADWFMPEPETKFEAQNMPEKTRKLSYVWKIQQYCQVILIIFLCN